MVQKQRTEGRNGLKMLRQVKQWWSGKIPTTGRLRKRHAPRAAR